MSQENEATLESLQEDLQAKDQRIEELESQVKELEDELASEREKAVNPRAAAMHKINGGGHLETMIVEETDDAGKVLSGKLIKARFTVPSISTGKGQYKATEIIANPELFAEIIQKLIVTKSSVLVIDKEKPLTKKELAELNKKA